MAQDFATFNRKVNGLVKEFDGTAGKQRLQRVAMLTKRDVDEAVRADLGDQSMSGWRRGNAIKITGRFDLKSDHEFEVAPAKRAAGPMRVLEQGRNADAFGSAYGAAVSSALAEPKLTKSGKRRKQRAKKARRWNGRTSGKGTWSDAVGLMEKRVPERVNKEVVKAIRRHLGKG